MLFKNRLFSEIDINAPFFDTLKADYPGSSNSRGFCEWFAKKSSSGERAIVAENETGIYAFIYIKNENEDIARMNAASLPAEERIKIGTFRIDESQQGQRLGEGAIGIVHWIWQNSPIKAMYVTVFEKQRVLIGLFKKFGFTEIGKNLNGELILIKDKRELDFSDPYKSYPFIKADYPSFGYLCIYDEYHDTMFPYSKLKGRPENLFEKCVSNGISKVYVGKAWKIDHSIGEPVFIYRINTNPNLQKRFTSCLTSFAMVTNIIVAKRNGQTLLSFEETLNQIKNKSVFNVEDIRRQYQDEKNFNIIELLYLGYFGAGNNINMDWLDNNGLWTNSFGVKYPTEVKLPREMAISIFQEAEKDISTILL